MKITCVNCHKVFEAGNQAASSAGNAGHVYCPHCYYQNPLPKPPEALLSLMTAEGEKREYRLDGYGTIGRHPKNTIQIMDRMISKQHVTLTYQDGSYFVQDLQSRNGTFINGQRIQQGHLKPGDELQLGTVKLNFHIGQSNKTLRQQVNFVADQASSPIAQIQQKLDDRDFLPAKELDAATIKKDYEKLRVAHELNRKIGLELNLERLLDQILEETFKIIPADRGVILLMDGSGELQPHCIKGRKGSKSSAEEISISRTILKSVVDDRAGMIISDAKIDERFSRAESIIVQGIRSAMAVPLVARSGGDILGAMHLDTQSAIGVFTEKDLQLVSVLASQAAIAIENARLAKQIEEETVIRAHLQRFLSPAVMDRLNKDHLTIRMGGELVNATVMFTDIRGFTSLSERYDPQELVLELNSYFALLVDEIFNREGTLDKFIGDAIMAVWGTFQSHEEDPLRAVQAAYYIQQQLHVFNEQRVAEGKVAFYTGIGINTGDVVAGNMGSAKRLEFTVIGDNVNVAARLCSEAKGGEIIISENTYLAVKDHFRCTELPPAEVKGKAEALKIFRVDELILHSAEEMPETGLNSFDI